MNKILIVLLLSVIAGTAGCECQTPNKTKPEDAAKAWAVSMGLTFKGASCTQVDTDNDGYVSCSVSTQETDRPIVITGLQCARLHIQGSEVCTAGCKLDSAKTSTSH